MAPVTFPTGQKGPLPPILHPGILFLNSLEGLLNELYILGLNGIDQNILALISRLKFEAESLGLLGAERSLQCLETARKREETWQAIQNLRLWASRFRTAYGLANLDLSSPPVTRLKLPSDPEIIPYLELAVLGAYSFPLAGRVLLYCFDLNQNQTLVIEDLATPDFSWRSVESLLFKKMEGDYLDLLENRLYFRGLKKISGAKNLAWLLPALGTTFDSGGKIDRASLWAAAQVKGPLRVRKAGEAIAFCLLGDLEKKILEKRKEEGYEAHLLIAPNPAPESRKELGKWKAFIPIAALFSLPDLVQPRLYSLINLGN